MAAKKRKWFISHPSGGLENVPAFFEAIKKFSETRRQVQILLPHAAEEDAHLTKEEIESSELVIAEVSMPSTGSGIELGWASAANKPIYVLHQGGSEPSPALKFVTEEFHVYVTEEHVLETLDKLL